MGVVVTGVFGSGFGSSQLLGSRGLGLDVQILDLGLTEDTASIVS